MGRPKELFIIFRKELAGYFNSAIAYIFMIVFTLLNGGLFMTQFFLAGRADMRAFFLGLPFLLSIFLPAVSMRLWSEERRGNTHELLLTFPIRPHELVLGKFFASLAFYVLTLLCTLPVPVMLLVLGRPDVGAITGGYLGAVLLGGFFLAVGILISGFCRDQIVAFIMSMTVCFGIYLLGTEVAAALLDGWVGGLGSFLRQCLGAADHFEPFCKGVADNRDAVYFLTGAAVCLVLNGFWIEGRMRPKARSIFTSAALLCAGIFLLTNSLVSGIQLGRFDMTDGQVYTVSQASKKILRELKSPVIVKFYVSPQDKMPTTMKMLEQDVCGKLEELRLGSKGRLQYKVIHMDAANITEGGGAGKQEETLEAQLSKKGIQPFQVESIQSDELGVRLIYSSLGISYKEKADELIPRIYPANLAELEYMILSKIYRMTLTEVPKIALVAPYEERTMDPNLKALLDQLGASGQLPENYREDTYDILELGLQYEGYPYERLDPAKGFEIPAGVKTLVILEPRELTPKQKYGINKFLVEGGSVFLAVQNYNFNYRPAERGIELVPDEKKPEVNDLLSAWGFKVDTRVLADEQSQTITLTRSANSLFGSSLPVKLPVQIILTGAEMNPRVSITSRLSAMFYLWGSALVIDDAKVKAQGLKIDTLLTSTRNSWTVPFKPEKLAVSDLRQTAGYPKGPFPLAIFAQGQFADAFQGNAPVEKGSPSDAAAAGAEEKKPVEKQEPGALKPAPGKLILIGAATPFQKLLLQGGGHLNFFLNSMDVLTLGDALIGIRSKVMADRALPKISRPAKVFWRFFTTLLVPFLIAIAGFMRFYFRRRSQSQYRKSLNIP